jgi:lipopolysaccharide export system protein LptA
VSRDLLWRGVGAQLALLLAMMVSAPAQTAQSPTSVQTGVPNALQGFSKNRDQPVKIDSGSLEVRDKDKVATFSGDVHLSQGDTTLRCKTLMVYYEDRAGGATLKAAQPGPRGQQQISRLEARGGVTVHQKDQTATGNDGVFDMKTNTVTLIGNVVVTQGQNVLRGDRLVVDLTSGVSRVEGGRVQGLFLPHSQRDTPAPGEKERGRPAAPGPTGPLRLN